MVPGAAGRSLIPTMKFRTVHPPRSHHRGFAFQSRDALLHGTRAIGLAPIAHTTVTSRADHFILDPRSGAYGLSPLGIQFAGAPHGQGTLGAALANIETMPDADWKTATAEADFRISLDETHPLALAHHDSGTASVDLTFFSDTLESQPEPEHLDRNLLFIESTNDASGEVLPPLLERRLEAISGLHRGLHRVTMQVAVDNDATVGFVTDPQNALLQIDFSALLFFLDQAQIFKTSVISATAVVSALLLGTTYRARHDRPFGMRFPMDTVILSNAFVPQGIDSAENTSPILLGIRPTGIADRVSQDGKTLQWLQSGATFMAPRHAEAEEPLGFELSLIAGAGCYFTPAMILAMESVAAELYKLMMSAVPVVEQSGR